MQRIPQPGVSLQRFRSVLSASLALTVVNANALASFGDSARQSRVFIATATGGSGGMLVALEREAPWTVTPIAPLDSPDGIVQSAFGRVFVVEPTTDRVRVFNGEGEQLHSFTVGEDTEPRDILCVNYDLAYVTRANATHLYRANPQTGEGEDAVDLSPLADDDGIPDMERMISDGERLYVQLQRINDKKPSTSGPGAIAVIDLATETLVDADPSTPQIDAIELNGPSVRLRMHVSDDGGFLLVSATNSDHLNFDGGIEYINLDTLTSKGFVVAELDFAAVGGFAMVDDEHGYYLNHTDIIPSNHLQPFTVSGGANHGPEIVFDGGAFLDALLIDPVTALLYMPASVGGVYIVDTTTDEQVTDEPVLLGGTPTDMVVGPGGHSPDINGDGAVNVADLLALLDQWGDCSAAPFALCPADLDEDGSVGVNDLLVLLANWSN